MQETNSAPHQCSTGSAVDRLAQYHGYCCGVARKAAQTAKDSEREARSSAAPSPADRCAHGYLIGASYGCPVCSPEMAAQIREQAMLESLAANRAATLLPSDAYRSGEAWGDEVER